MDINKPIIVKSPCVAGQNQKTTTNFNDKTISQLTLQQIQVITKVLDCNKYHPTMQYFGYELR
jgi:hypothetical protein